MKKLLLTALLIATFGQLYAEVFTAGGMEPFWDLTLKHKNDHLYQAVLSYPNETGIMEIKAVVTKTHHKDYVTYQGQGSNGKPLSIMTVERPCVSEGKGDTLSHLVIVNAFEGCGGKVLINSDDNEQTDNNQTNGQVAHKKTAREKAKQLNTQGFRLYKQGKYYQALPLFHRATKTDNRYALGQYNFACTAAIVLDRFDCHQDDSLLELAKPDKIFTALKKSIMLDPKRLARSKTDPDLALIRKSYRYYRDILGYSPKNDGQFKEILTNAVWEQSIGFYAHHGKPIRLIFRKGSNNEVMLRQSRPKNGHDDAWEDVYKTGKYRVHNGTVTLIFNSDKHGAQHITGRINNEGDLHFAGASDSGILPLDDYRFRFPTPCEAY